MGVVDASLCYWHYVVGGQVVGVSIRSLERWWLGGLGSVGLRIGRIVLAGCA